MRRQRGTRRTTRASAGGSRDTLSVGSSRGHSGELQCEAAAGVFADVVDVDDMVNILAGWDPQRPRTLTSWTPESRVNITGFMLSVRLCCPAGAEIMFLLLSAKSVARLHNIIGYARRARPAGDLAYPEREGHRRELGDIGRQQLETPADWRESTLQASQWSDHCRAAGYRRIIGVTARELRPRADDYVVRVTESARKTRVAKPSHNIT